MGIISWIVLGGLAGWVASLIMGTDEKQGIFLNIVLGVVGAFIGGYLVGFFGGSGFTGFNLTSFLVALLGAVVLIGLFKLVSGKKKS